LNVTKRLYYDQPDLLEFDSTLEALLPAQSPADNQGSAAENPSLPESRPAVVLRETAFYPTSGGQIHDTGWISLPSGQRLRIAEVADTEDGRIVHYLEAPTKPPINGEHTAALAAGSAVHGIIDADRRRDHMQQHTGQHVLSAAFIELFQFPTVSFHMGDDYCSIDLATDSLTTAQTIAAEKRANEILFENRPVRIRYVRRDEAEKLGLRKLPPEGRDELRLIEIADFDLSACGGTHVSATGQIGSILLRKTEKTRQGMRVEFVCGARAVRTVRRDYTTLTEAAALYSTQLNDVPEMIRKGFADTKTLRRDREDALNDLAASMAKAALAAPAEEVVSSASTPDAEQAAPRPRLIVRTFTDRDANFAKVFAQRVTKSGVPVIALVGSIVGSPSLVFAQSPEGTFDMGALLKQVLSSVSGRGGGSRDFAQGGVSAGCDINQLLQQAAQTIQG
jgi:alanyl-tRNA synthetase